MSILLLMSSLLSTAPYTVMGPYGNAEILGTGGGSVTGGFTISGACTVDPVGMVCCHDFSGVRCGWPDTDVAASEIYLYGYSASPLSTGGSQTGGDLNLAGGLGIITSVMTAANCGTDTITLTIDGSPTVGTEGTEFDCSGTDAACATQVASWIDGLTGVDSCAGAGCTDHTGVAGTSYVWRTVAATVDISTGDATCAALTEGADGTVAIVDDATVGGALTVTGLVTATGGVTVDSDSAKLCSGAAGCGDLGIYFDGTDAQLDCPTCVTGIKFNASPVVGTISIGADPGTLGLLVDSNISATPAAGTEMSYCLGHDANCFLLVYTEADSAGGIQNSTIRLTNALFDVSATAGITASVTQTQGQQPLTSSVNEVSVVANANDTVTLPEGAAGRDVTVINNGANDLQVFPASGDDLGGGIDASTVIMPGEFTEFVAHDGTTWHVQAASSITHGEMFHARNTDAFVINAQTNLHCYHNLAGSESGMTTDAASLAGGWTQDDGGAGVSFPIASIADAGGGDITVTTTGSHLLAIGDIISQTNLTNAAYEGVFDVLTVPGATTYTVTAAWGATDTGTMDQCAYIQAPVGGGGKYDLKWSASATSASSNETFDFVIYVDAAVVLKTEDRRKFGTASDFGSFGGNGFTTIADGEKVVFVLNNNGSAANVTFRQLTVGAHRL